MTPFYKSKRDAIRALISVYGEQRDCWPKIIDGFVLLVELGVVERGDMANPAETARTMLYHRTSGKHGWPEIKS